MPPEESPLVRAVVVNHDGGALVERCVEHLLATDWPEGRLEVTLVDNASTDGSADRVERRFPRVRVVHSRRNLGFGRANNLALRDRAGADAVALVNPDAFVEAGWLRPLVAALHEPGVGAACPRILLEPRYAEVVLETEGFSPGRGDPRVLGARVDGVRREGVDVWDQTLFPAGFFDEEVDPASGRFRWSGPSGTVWLPGRSASPDRTASPDRADDHDAAPPDFELVVRGERTKALSLVPRDGAARHEIGPEPRPVAVVPSGPWFDVVNSAGVELVDGGYGVDRGFGQRLEPGSDAGSAGERDPLLEPTDVFAWSGAAVLLAPEYLDDVGLFDEAFFLYSEDLDLAWRGRRRGWRHRYVPGAVVRHAHGATVGQRSRLADHHSQRNALLTIAKHAPARIVVRELRRYAGDLLRLLRAEVLLPLRRRERPQPVLARRRARVLASVAAALPGALRARVRMARSHRHGTSG